MMSAVTPESLTAITHLRPAPGPVMVPPIRIPVRVPIFRFSREVSLMPWRFRASLVSPFTSG